MKHKITLLENGTLMTWSDGDLEFELHWKEHVTARNAMVGGCIFIGTTGTGKTFIPDEFIDAYKSMQISSGLGLPVINRVVASMLTLNDNLQKLASCHLLYIDDLGKETGGSNLIRDLIFHREEYLRNPFYGPREHFITFISTNLTMDQIAERYGEYIKDRILALGDVIVLEGESKRPK